MTVENLFIFDAIISLPFGLLLIFSPLTLPKLFLIDAVITGGAFAAIRCYGIVLPGGYSSFVCQACTPSQARRGCYFLSPFGVPLLQVITFTLFLRYWE